MQGGIRVNQLEGKKRKGPLNSLRASKANERRGRIGVSLIRCESGGRNQKSDAPPSGRNRKRMGSPLNCERCAKRYPDWVEHRIPPRRAIKNPNVLGRLRSVHDGQRKESSNSNELPYTCRPAKLIGTDQSDREHHSPKNQNQFKWLLIFASEISRRSLHLERIVFLIGRTALSSGITRSKKQDGPK
jgi:hypothetical protein